MSAPVLALRDVGKAFRRYRREIHRVLGWFGVAIAPAEERWVLEGLDLEVPAGQALGVVGRNGAGKSTLLKMIAGTLRPSRGEVEVKGRVAAILELGMGFNPEFTGRRNVYNAAGLMGFSRAQIDGAIAQIEAFAEIPGYFDQPVRVYSSGMQMRLAFAVATAFRPDILIIDEALSVGDTYFQHKSFERIRSFQAQGTTLILVSHDAVALQSLCDRAILINAGTIAVDGSPEQVLDYYNALLADQEGASIETIAHPDGRVQTISGSREATIVDAALHDGNGRKVETVSVGAPVTLRVTARANTGLATLVLGYSIKDRLGQTLFGTNTAFSGQSVADVAAGDEIDYAIAFPCMLGTGSYSIALSLVGGDSHLETNYEWRDLALLFTVVNLDKPPFSGQTYMPPEIAVEVRRKPAAAAVND